MPQTGIRWQPHEDILRYEEIFEIVRLTANLGVREVRLTGGEPLVRTGLPALVAMLARIPGIEDISLTTNGLLLEKYAEELARAGLRRLNISLDTLDPQRYARITRGGDFERVWRGIQAAEATGITLIKLNMVVMKGVNDDEVEAMARLTLEHPWVVRYIELMPIQNQENWGVGFPLPAEAFISVVEILSRLEPLELEPVDSRAGSGPALEYYLPGGAGKIGFISPLSEEMFCNRCNRLRLTADGNLRPCLMSDLEIPLRDALRRGEDIQPLIEKAVALKPASHGLARNQLPNGRTMAQIGG
jgi:cyclic pyranopterin phosphate synthase